MERDGGQKNRQLLLDAANRVAIDILTSRTGVEALRHIAEAARQISGARYAAMGVSRMDGNGLDAFITTGLAIEEEKKIGPLPSGKGLLGLLLERQTPLRLRDLSEHPASAGFPVNHPPMKSFLGVPILRGNEALGSLYLTDKIEGDEFTLEDEHAVLSLGSHAAIAIYNLQQIERQRALVSGLIAAQEEERRAVAYELHDGLTQFVMASYAHMQAFQRAHKSGHEERAEREREKGMSYLKEAVQESRRLVNGLRSLALDDLGLAGALEQLVNEEKVRAGWEEANFLHNLAGQRFDKSLETAVYRVAQEAITNARKHACAGSIKLALLLGHSGSEKTLVLEVSDRGVGFVPEEKMGDYAHVGMQSMFERVNLLGGEFTLRSAPGKGVAIKAVFPLLELRGKGEI